MLCKKTATIATGNQNSEKTRPLHRQRFPNPCDELAEAESPNLRAGGTANSYEEKTARNEAKRDARTELANMLEVAIERASVDYEKKCK